MTGRPTRSGDIRHRIPGSSQLWPSLSAVLGTTAGASALALFLFSGVAEAQGRCGPRESITSVLEQKFSESRRFIASNSREVVEIWANPDTGTWTVTGTNTRGITCIFSAGQSHQFIAPEEGGDL